MGVRENGPDTFFWGTVRAARVALGLTSVRYRTCDNNRFNNDLQHTFAPVPSNETDIPEQQIQTTIIFENISADADARRALSAEEEDALSSMKRRDQDLDRPPLITYYYYYY